MKFESNNLPESKALPPWDNFKHGNLLFVFQQDAKYSFSSTFIDQFWGYAPLARQCAIMKVRDIYILLLWTACYIVVVLFSRTKKKKLDWR